MIYKRGPRSANSCRECEFFHETYLRTRKVCLANGNEEIEHADVIDPFCPFTEIKEHGDLADVDAYRDEFMQGVYDLCRDDPNNNRANAIIDLYDLIPVLIQKEE